MRVEVGSEQDVAVSKVSAMWSNPSQWADLCQDCSLVLEKLSLASLRCVEEWGVADLLSCSRRFAITMGLWKICCYCWGTVEFKDSEAKRAVEREHGMRLRIAVIRWSADLIIAAVVRALDPGGQADSARMMKILRFVISCAEQLTSRSPLSLEDEIREVIHLILLVSALTLPVSPRFASQLPSPLVAELMRNTLAFTHTLSARIERQDHADFIVGLIGDEAKRIGETSFGSQLGIPGAKALLLIDIAERNPSCSKLFDAVFSALSEFSLIELCEYICVESRVPVKVTILDLVYLSVRRICSSESRDPREMAKTILRQFCRPNPLCSSVAKNCILAIIDAHPITVCKPLPLSSSATITDISSLQAPFWNQQLQAILFLHQIETSRTPTSLSDRIHSILPLLLPDNDTPNPSSSTLPQALTLLSASRSSSAATLQRLPQFTILDPSAIGYLTASTIHLQSFPLTQETLLQLCRILHLLPHPPPSLLLSTLAGYLLLKLTPTPNPTLLLPPHLLQAIHAALTMDPSSFPLEIRDPIHINPRPTPLLRHLLFQTNTQSLLASLGVDTWHNEEPCFRQK
uniref:Uncharacterized protein n=1 Tax=Compsopogon caeruleus TaxID=31354 RepID=A0A7S1XGV5_9RHOD